MAEPFSPPNKFQLAKAKEVYSDPLMYWAMNAAIKSLNQMKGQDNTPNYWREFYALARLIIINWDAATAFNLVELASEDLADKKKYKWLGKEMETTGPGIKVEIKIDPSAILLKDKIKITDLAKQYGLKVKGNKAVCPFHDDKDPSLSLNNKKGVFHCFGCNVKGDIVTFVRMLEDLKNGD